MFCLKFPRLQGASFWRIKTWQKMSGSREGLQKKGVEEGPVEARVFNIDAGGVYYPGPGALVWSGSDVQNKVGSAVWKLSRIRILYFDKKWH